MRFPIVLIALFCLPAVGQTAASATDAAKAEFDVVSIKLNPTGSSHSHVHTSSENGNVSAQNVALKELLGLAFDVPETQIVGIAGAVSSARFDIDAKSDDALNAQMKALAPGQSDALRRRMLQAMLADRFKLIVHRETREMPVFALVLAKGGPLLATSKQSGTHVEGSRGKLVATGITTADLADELASDVGRMVVDKTEMSGKYDLMLKWTPDDSGAAAAADAPPSIYTAVQEQLGLKLEPQKLPVAVLMVDRVEIASSN